MDIQIDYRVGCCGASLSKIHRIHAKADQDHAKLKDRFVDDTE